MSCTKVSRLALALFLASPPALGADAAERAPAAETEQPAEPSVEDLGNERYRIGPIELDKAAGRFRVPATVLRREPPLEFLAATRQGYKGYESLLELSASALEFNLACILVGLDPERGRAPRYHFAPEPAQGDAVEIWVAWEREGEEKRVEAAKLIRRGEKTAPLGEWVYIGSGFTPDGRYLAALDGTAVGFVHDPASIIEHRTGFGLDEFGLIEPDRELLPPVGTRVTVIVERRARPEGPKQGDPPGG
jgi:hypothetical protein